MKTQKEGSLRALCVCVQFKGMFGKALSPLKMALALAFLEELKPF